MAEGKALDEVADLAGLAGRRAQELQPCGNVEKQVADLKAFYGEAQTARSELESLRQSADLAAESQRLTTLRYQAGEATVLEVVDSQNTLTTAQNAFGDGQVRFRVAVANLQTLTGKF